MTDAFNPGVVDLVGMTPDGETVLLLLVQDKPWTGSDVQIETLQAKVHNYVGYAVDGQMVREMPETAGKPWRIVVDCQTGEPDEKARVVFAHLAKALPKHGGSILVLDPPDSTPAEWREMDHRDPSA